MPDFSLAVPFLTDDPAFSAGFRLATLYARLRRTKRRRLRDMVYEPDEEQVRLMAHRLGWGVSRRESVGGWVFVTFRRRD